MKTLQTLGVTLLVIAGLLVVPMYFPHLLPEIAVGENTKLVFQAPPVWAIPAAGAAGVVLLVTGLIGEAVKKADEKKSEQEKTQQRG